MKLLTFARLQEPRLPCLGVMDADQIVIDLEAARDWAIATQRLPVEALPQSMFDLIQSGPQALDNIANLLIAIEIEDPVELIGPDHQKVGFRLNEIVQYPPLPRPMSVRDFYAFEEHVAAAHANRGKTIPPEWYQFPVFYFSNPNAIYGPEEVVVYPRYSQAVDYELEVACVIAHPGVNISADQAENYIFGYLIFNDWSARDVQRLEMRVGLGPAKGKDFASSLGPWIVTPDELQDRHSGRPGVYDLAMTAYVNGELRSQGNWQALHYSFGQMIARASEDTWLLPGDVIGSGTVGSGCLLELTRGQGPWLKPGDRVELEIERLGVLRNSLKLAG
jgi:2-keto-4-pentenoate hydratase/2-oxohepta-3-ene-1,7-dioic acid hydratase in catechol pathway